jgi:hypothetical protein
MKTLIIGGPCCGKSTFASSLGAPVYCTDPRSLVKVPKEGVTYLPEGLDWSSGSEYVLKNWLSMEGPYCIEGVGVVRALRKWKDSNTKDAPLPFDKIIYFRNQHPSVTRLPGQDAMEKAIATIWREIFPRFIHVTVFYKWD